MRYSLVLFLLLANFCRADDLSFSTALDLALRNTPSLAAQNAKVAAAQAAAIPAAALPDPKLLLGADNVPIDGPDRGSLNRDFMTMQRIGVMQEFVNVDKRHARAEAANAATERALAERIVVQQRVRTETAQAWLQRFYLEHQRALFDALDRENELLVAAVQAQLAAGKGSSADAILPREEALTLADRRDVLNQQIIAAKASLKQWLGDDAYLPLAGDPPDFTVEANALNKNLHRHPELIVYGPMVAQAEAELHEALAEKKSDWNVELNYQKRGALYADMMSLQLTYTLPIFPNSRQNPQIVAKKKALEQLDDERESMLREHAAELETDTAEYSAIAAQLQRLRTTRSPLVRNKNDLVMASYRAGKADLATVIAARRDAVELQLRENELASRQAQLAAKLYYAYEEISQ